MTLRGSWSTRRAKGHVLKHHATSSRALSGNGDLRWVAIEQVDVLLRPLKSHVLVKDACVNDTFAVYFIG